MKAKNPVRPIRTVRSGIDDSGVVKYINRILVGTPTIGMVRIEWVNARYHQIIPMNWSQVNVVEWMDGYYPLRYQVADAQNILVMRALEGDFEWLFLLEHDVLLPDNTMMMLNEYMREGKYPIVSGLYYSRSRPSEPLTFRGRGNSVYTDWKMGDVVWCDGVPTGCLLIHQSILRLMLVAPVAVGAACRCLAGSLACTVAARALVHGVRAAQSEIGPLMVELLGDELDDVGLASLVLALTGAALRALADDQAAVEPLLRAQVVPDVPVAIDAQLRLTAAVPAVMAVGALPFELCVRAAHLARHEQGFDLRRARRGCDCKHGNEQRQQ